MVNAFPIWVLVARLRAYLFLTFKIKRSNLKYKLYPIESLEDGREMFKEGLRPYIINKNLYIFYDKDFPSQMTF